ncbi:Probable sensor histidine kinase HK [Mycobacterium tuberculosis variant bovis]|uniref:Probable sensor histidine kinase HK n=25 Tax=Mycobacterium tuberculosis TaxID=1773 RepID=HK12_MYCTO|nr:RecName: Full=Probable sensor histidine kinase HK [Mycobacterium tuberculosis CDC1551]ABR04955.1 two component sensor kinase [Mycobacterium tuberculosis F11]ACT23641.1 two component system sensor kinase [Mycobacterium tuberculosis KZN 1435]AEB02741.1 two component system sensor kinase [Mycobacterium tuberculosis KZN 4207]AFM47991.1 two component system sensor kinase [Mycobacterium tuberculosis KZN 605]EAY59008.1 hypothetical protein TBCG_00596 [Mycobacterium tuberculosis C]EBA41116.1 two-c
MAHPMATHPRLQRRHGARSGSSRCRHRRPVPRRRSRSRPRWRAARAHRRHHRRSGPGIGDHPADRARHRRGGRLPAQPRRAAARRPDPRGGANTDHHAAPRHRRAAAGTSHRRRDRLASNDSQHHAHPTATGPRPRTTVRRRRQPRITHPVGTADHRTRTALRRPRPADQLSAALRSALEETRRLSGLADQLLTLARADRPESHPSAKAVPITPLLHESVARFAATGADITTRAEPDLFVSIDPDHLRRILTAVLDNAITHGDGEIAVTAHARDGAVDIGVRDHGPGFADHFLPVAFDRFTRADTARGGRGSGLGLAIVAALTTTHGGHANATNHPDGGAELRITLPTPRPPFHEELPRITSSDTKDPNREHDTSDQ